MVISDHFVKLSKHTAAQVTQAGVRIREHEFVSYQGRLFQRLWLVRPKFDHTANCFGLDTNMFYPEPTERNKAVATDESNILDDSMTIQAQTKYLSRICQECPFLHACREWAIANNEHGVWGGTTESQRKVIRMRRHQMVMYASHAITQASNATVLGRVA